MVTKVDRFGRILIPKKLRKKFGLVPGVALELAESENQIVLKVSKKVVRKIGEDKGQIEISDDFDVPLSDFEEYMP